MEDSHRENARRMRSLIDRTPRDPLLFREALRRVPPVARDACLDLALGLEGLPEDGPELPAGCVPYLPCPVDALLRLVEHAPVRASDVFVDVGSGLGRAGALVHLLTGARVVGLEVQPPLVAAARALATRLRLSDLSFVEGDAVKLPATLAAGSVFLLYCPFSGDRLAQLLALLEPIAHTRSIRICCVDLPLPAREWLTPTPMTSASADLAIYRSTLAS